MSFVEGLSHVLLWVVAVANTVALLVLVRRTRIDTDGSAGDDHHRPTLLNVGDDAPPLELVHPDGSASSSDLLLSDVAVVAFLSTTCRGCLDQLPALRAYAERNTEIRTIAVVSGDLGDAPELALGLSGVPRLSRAAESQPTPSVTYQVRYLPCFLLVLGGRILATTGEASELPSIEYQT